MKTKDRHKSRSIKKRHPLLSPESGRMQTPGRHFADLASAMAAHHANAGREESPPPPVSPDAVNSGPVELDQVLQLVPGISVHWSVVSDDGEVPADLRQAVDAHMRAMPHATRQFTEV